MAPSTANEERVLVLAPTRRDAEVTQSLLHNARLSALLCDSSSEMAEAIASGAGAAVLTDDAVRANDLSRIVAALHRQPEWSELPLIVLVRAVGTGTAHLGALRSVPGLIVLERPVNARTLMSTLHAALGARRRQYQIRHQLEEIQSSHARLKAADRAKDEFLAMLAHELRNPLAPIRTAAQVLKLAGDGSPGLEQTRAIIERQVQHMTKIVDDLLDVSRVTRGLVRLTLKPVDLREVIFAAIEQCRALVESRGQRLQLDVPADPLHVNGDDVRLVQIVANLLSNAAKYSDLDSDINLSVEAESDSVVLRIRDHGVGISPDLLPKIFDLFTQADRSSARSHGGLGLGLALVKRLVELHAGTVEALSDGVDRGSQFVVRLPRLTLEPDFRAVDPRDAASFRSRHDHPQLTLMVVDDNKDAADVLAALLVIEGHAVTVENTAESAIERARSETPRVLLLDIGLPGMDGYELARRLRADPRTSSSILIALTGYGQESDRQRSRDAGFDHHLVKPVDPKTLSALLSGIAEAA